MPPARIHCAAELDHARVAGQLGQAEQSTHLVCDKGHTAQLIFGASTHRALWTDTEVKHTLNSAARQYRQQLLNTVGVRAAKLRVIHAAVLCWAGTRQLCELSYNDIPSWTPTSRQGRKE